jgi:signal transduction histidine kinase/DICT domain-containing protein
MINPSSLLEQLLQTVPNLLPQTYFKSSLIALSRAIEDSILTGEEKPLVISTRHSEFSRHRQIARKIKRTYAIVADAAADDLEIEGSTKIVINPDDDLTQEWIFIVVGENYGACIICRAKNEGDVGTIERGLRFEGIWAVDQLLSRQAARLLLPKIVAYRPELASEIDRIWQLYDLTQESFNQMVFPRQKRDKSPIFAQRLLDYLQASQYKLLKATKTIAEAQQQEKSINTITNAIRSSLDPAAILTVAATELGRYFVDCRCIVYFCDPNARSASIEAEYLPQGFNSLQGQTRNLQDNSIAQLALQQEDIITIEDLEREYPQLRSKKTSQKNNTETIAACLLAPIRDRGTTLAILEIHRSQSPYRWQKTEIALVRAITTQVGIALAQARAYTKSVQLNQQLEALERSQSNLVAIVGHELRTPLSTIRICLESLASEPEMEGKVKRIMLSTALKDAERLGQLVQDFLLLSRLESGQEKWDIEPVRFEECLNLALIGIRSQFERVPQISIELPTPLDFVLTDAEKLVRVLLKLLDNACKFTDYRRKVTVKARKRSISNQGIQQKPMLEVIIRDTGTGIESSQLEAIFDRFYQEENALRRNYGGTGLGLAICRRIVEGLGGRIWAESAGKDKGSSFHFTLPLETN